MITSSGYSTQSMLNTMTSQQNKLYDSFNKLINNQKFTNISDSPIDAADLVRINKQLNEIGAYARNIENAATQIKEQDDIFSTIVDKMQRINDLAIQAANSPSGESGFKACQVEIEELTNTIIDLANTTYDGKYIFAGTNVTTKPFALSDDGSITYNGTPENNTAGYQRSLEIADDIKVDLNSAGDTIFGTYDPNDPTKSSGLFGVLGKLNKIMNTEPGDNKAVSNLLDDIQGSIKHISEIQSVHSTAVSKLNMTKEVLDNSKLNLTSRKAEISEPDMATAISDLVKQQYAYQASMQAYSMISNMSLLDYMN